MTDIRERALGIKEGGHTSSPQARIQPQPEPAEPPKRKRGRPSKADIAAREAAAAVAEGDSTEDAEE